MQRRSPKKNKYEIAEHAYAINPSMSQQEIHERINVAIAQLSQREKYEQRERSLLSSLTTYAKENFLGARHGNDFQIECYIYSTILNYLLNRAVKDYELEFHIGRLLRSTHPETKLHKAYVAWLNDADEKEWYEIERGEFELYAPRFVTIASVVGVGAFLLASDASTQTKILISCLVGAGNLVMHYGSSIPAPTFFLKKKFDAIGLEVEVELSQKSVRKIN